MIDSTFRLFCTFRLRCWPLSEHVFSCMRFIDYAFHCDSHPYRLRSYIIRLTPVSVGSMQSFCARLRLAIQPQKLLSSP